MTGFIATSLKLQSIMTAHNQWLSTTRSIPYWITSFYESQTKDSCSHIELPYESNSDSASDCIEFTNELSFITSGGLNIGHHLEQLTVILSSREYVCSGKAC
jgi:hypothetical protein